MLTQVKSSLPQALNFKRYPKWKTQQVCRLWTVDRTVVCGMAVIFFHSGLGLWKVSLHFLSDHFCQEENYLLIWSLSTAFSCDVCIPTWIFSCVSLQESREFPFSDHDNKHALKDNISVFTHVSMKRKSGKCSDPSPRYSMKGNHIFSVSCWYLSGCGAPEDPWWSQTAELPLLPVPRWSWQQPWRTWGERHSLPGWFYGETGC